MAFLEKLRAHRGGLVRLPTELFWYGGRGWDSTPGRLCLLLDADPITARAWGDAGDATTAGDATAAARASAAAHLLIDGRPGWVRVVEGDVEVIDEAR